MSNIRLQSPGRPLSKVDHIIGGMENTLGDHVDPIVFSGSNSNGSSALGAYSSPIPAHMIAANSSAVPVVGSDPCDTFVLLGGGASSVPATHVLSSNHVVEQHIVSSVPGFVTTTTSTSGSNNGAAIMSQDLRQELLELASSSRPSAECMVVIPPPATNADDVVLSELLSLMNAKGKASSAASGTATSSSQQTTQVTTQHASGNNATVFQEPAKVHQNWGISAMDYGVKVHDDALFDYRAARSSAHSNANQRNWMNRNNYAAKMMRTQTQGSSSTAAAGGAGGSYLQSFAYNPFSLCRFLFGALLLLAGVGILIYCAVDTANVDSAASASSQSASASQTQQVQTIVPIQTTMPMQTGIPIHTGIPMQTGIPIHTGIPMQTGMPIHTGMPIQTGTMYASNGQFVQQQNHGAFVNSGQIHTPGPQVNYKSNRDDFEDEDEDEDEDEEEEEEEEIQVSSGKFKRYRSHLQDTDE